MKALGVGFLSMSAVALVACGSSSNTAPVVYGTQPQPTARVYNSPSDVYQHPLSAAPTQPVYVAQSNAPSGYVQVQPGDTVYAIARRYGVHPNTIIADNQLSPPYALAIGQSLRLSNATTISAQPASSFTAPPRTIVARDALYQVRHGDTLYSIAKVNGVTVEGIANANRLTPPYDLQVGRQLLIPGARANAAAPVRNVNAPQTVEDLARGVSFTPQPKAKNALFDWPLKGAVISSFGSGAPGRRNDGVNIAAPSGSPVRAAADGEVVYRGSELDGYGNLLLVKHEGGFVTAYAHNNTMLVRKGQKVRRGQVIGKVGQTGAVSEPQLHFEIRQNLKSVDPMEYLNRN